MNLQRKISLIFVLIVAAFGTGTYVILSLTLTPAFDRLEYEAAEADMARAQQGLVTMASAVGNFATDWAQWDDAFDFMLGGNPDFTDVNLGPETLIDADFNMALLFDRNGQLRWGKYIYNGSEVLSEFTDTAMRYDIVAALLRHEAPLSEIDGMYVGPEGLSFVSSRPIVHSDRSGPIAGTLILGQLIDSDRIQQLRRMTEVDLTLSIEEHEKRLPASEMQTPEPDTRVFQTTGRDLRISSQGLHDLTDARIASLIVRSPRGISGLGREAVQGVMVSIAILGSAIIVGMWWLLRFLVVSPIGRLQQLMTEIQDGDALSERIEVRREDEIGQLAHAFNTMIGRLEESKRRYIEQSFKAGMAEFAVGVLHNIRNMLMPIINGVVHVHDAVSQPVGQNMARAIDELCSDSTRDERKMKLQQYLAAANNQISEERRQFARELKSMNRQLDQVTKVLQDQEQFTHAEPVLESVNLAEAVAEARDVIPLSHGLRISVVVDDELAKQSVRAHRVGLLQVLSNILLNAYESIIRSGRQQGRIDIRAGTEENLAERRVRITISDTGAGIEGDALQRIFERGFTSKVDSVGGVGLHWSANALASMHGHIEACSLGVDNGAQFHITLQAA